MDIRIRFWMNEVENIFRRGIIKNKKGNMVNYMSSFI